MYCCMPPFVRLLAVSVLALGFSSVLPGCGGKGGGGTATRGGSVRVTVTWPDPSRLLPAAANSIRASFKLGTTDVASQVLARPASGNQTTATFSNLKVGNLTLTATAYPNTDATGVAQAQGSTPVTITNGQTTAVTLTMDSTITRIDVTPTPLTLAIASTATLTATARDANGAVVLISPGKGQWSSVDTAVATVTQQGVVTGVNAGGTTLSYTDTESGKIGSVSVTVKASTPISFDVATQFPTPPLTDQVTAGDLDNDGKPDIVVSSNQELGILYGKGDGTFEPYVRLLAWSEALANRELADMNGDGRLDILFHDGQGLETMFNQGGRNFGAPVLLSAPGISGMFVGDVNGDNRPDVALSFWGTNYVGTATLYLNNGSGTLNFQGSVSHGGIVEGVAAGDLNGDGLIDLAVSFETSTVNQSGVEIYYGTAQGGYVGQGSMNIGSLNMVQPTFADLNKDGKLDMLLCHYWGHALATWINQGGVLGSFLEYSSAPYPINIRLADFNGDGLIDVAIANAGSSHISIYQGKGGGQFANGVTFETGGSNVRGIYVADFNKDGKPDIAAESEPSPFVCVLLNNGL